MECHKIMTPVSSNSSDRTEENYDKPRESQLWSASQSNTGPAKEKSDALTFDFICRAFSAYTQCGQAMNTHYAMNSAQVRMYVNDTGRWMAVKGFPVFAGYGYGRDNQSGRACWEKQ